MIPKDLFIKSYSDYLAQINAVVLPDHHPVLNEMANLDPGEFLHEDTYFLSELQAMGYVWSLFLKRVGDKKAPNSEMKGVNINSSHSK
jgi:hypothetical protein